MRTTRFRMAAGVVVFAAAFLTNARAEEWAPASGKWERLERCRLATRAKADGDSFVVRQGAREFRFRLYAVDAPETAMTYKVRVRDQARHFGITSKQTIAAGHEAERLARCLLAEPFTVETCWQDAKGNGRTTRYFAVITVGGRDLAEQLAAAGLARVYGFTPDRPGFSEARLRGMEARARTLKLGAYALAGATTAGRKVATAGNGAHAPLSNPKPAREGSRLPPSLSSFPRARPADERIDVNTATVAELAAVPGLGPKLAHDLVAGRPYENLVAITRVRGIGPKTLKRLEPFLVVGGR